MPRRGFAEGTLLIRLDDADTTCVALGARDFAWHSVDVEALCSPSSELYSAWS